MAIHSRERAYRLYRQQGDDEAAVRVAIGMAMDLLSARGDAAIASGWLERARTLLRDNPDSRWAPAVDGVEGYLAWAYEKNMSRAIDLSERALARTRELGHVDFEMLALAQLGAVLVTRGRVGDGMRMLDQATAAVTAGELSDPEAAANVCCYLVTACASVRDLDRVAEWSRHVMEMSQSWTDRSMFNFPRTEYARVLIWWGRWEEAEQELLGVIEEMAQRPVPAALGMLRLADLRRRQGRFDETTALLDDLESRPNRSGLGQVTVAARAALASTGATPKRPRSWPNGTFAQSLRMIRSSGWTPLRSWPGHERLPATPMVRPARGRARRHRVGDPDEADPSFGALRCGRFLRRSR